MFSFSSWEFSSVSFDCSRSLIAIVSRASDENIDALRKRMRNENSPRFIELMTTLPETANHSDEIWCFWHGSGIQSCLVKTNRLWGVQRWCILKEKLD